MVSLFGGEGFFSPLLPPLLAGWCKGNIPASSAGAAGSSPAPAPTFEVIMNVQSCNAFLLGALFGLAVFDFVMLFYYILV